jgi:CTP synthase
MIPSGKNPESGLVEIMEIPSHPYFIGVQYHPELKSTVERPAPLFVHFVKAAREFHERRDAIKNPLLQSELI